MNIAINDGIIRIELPFKELVAIATKPPVQDAEPPPRGPRSNRPKQRSKKSKVRQRATKG